MESSEVKRIRNKLGLTQEEVAEIFGFSGPGSVGNIEIGYRTPNRLFARMLRLLDSLSPKKADELLNQLRKHGNKQSENRLRATVQESLT